MTRSTTSGRRRWLLLLLIAAALTSVSQCLDPVRCTGSFFKCIWACDCEGTELRVFFNEHDGKCTIYYHDVNCSSNAQGLGNIHNTFNTIEECEDICIPVSSSLYPSASIQMSSFLAQPSQSFTLNPSSTSLLVSQMASSDHTGTVVQSGRPTQWSTPREEKTVTVSATSKTISEKHTTTIIKDEISFSQFQPSQSFTLNPSSTLLLVSQRASSDSITVIRSIRPTQSSTPHEEKTVTVSATSKTISEKHTTTIIKDKTTVSFLQTSSVRSVRTVMSTAYEHQKPTPTSRLSENLDSPGPNKMRALYLYGSVGVGILAVLAVLLALFIFAVMYCRYKRIMNSLAVKGSSISADDVPDTIDCSCHLLLCLDTVPSNQSSPSASSSYVV